MPTSLESIRQEARDAHAAQRWLEAEQQYRTLINAEANVDDIINLGAILRSQGRYKEGATFYKQWLLKYNDNQNLLLNACNCLNDNQEAHISVNLLETALAKRPGERGLIVGLADAYLNNNDSKKAIALLQHQLSLVPKDKKIWIRLGLCHGRLQQLPEALHAFTMAHQIEPNDWQMLANRITVLKDLGRFEEAEQLATELPEEQFNQPDVANAIAGLWMAQNKLVEATELYQQLARQRPQCAAHWLNWAASLRGLRHTVAPHQILLRGIQHQPTDIELQQALAQILAEMAKPEAVQRLHKCWQRDERELKTIHLFSQQFLGISSAPIDSKAIAEQARAWEKRLMEQSLGPLWPDLMLEPMAGRCLRVGYLSADFCNHPVGRFMLPVLNHHDRNCIETWAINSGSHNDWITEHIRKGVDHWLDVRFLSGLQAARTIADLRLDVLVELGGFTGDSRLDILCHRPAPVQLSYLGYPAPTYLSCVDGWIGDEVLFEKLNNTDRNAHPLMHIKGGYMVFDSGGELPLPERNGGAKFRFGSFNHARKLSAASIDLFCQVLAANPNTELVLKSISFCEEAEKARIKKRFQAAGLAAERLVLLDWVEGGLNHLQRYSAIDVGLDPIPYGGATTTAEALWMGVPVVALAGAGMVGRLAASLLVHGNQSQWLAQTEKEYVAIASQLAAAGPRHRDQRLALRRQLEQSPLADGKRLSNALEQLYLKQRTEIKNC